MVEKANPISKAFGLELNKSRFISGKDLTPWLTVSYKIDELINEFWGIKSKSRLIAVTQELDNKIWRGLVSEWNSFGGQPGQFRLSQNLIKNILDLSLGKGILNFDLKKMSALEINLFENFFVEVENFWRDYWRVAETKSQGNLNFLVWAVELDNQELGLIAVGVPTGLLPKGAIEAIGSINIRELACELNVAAPLDLTVGKTRLSINEVKHLEPGDLVIFEQSDISHFIWEKNELYKVPIRLTLPHKEDGQWQDLYNNLEIGEMIEEQNVHDDLLADLPIELTAQFKGVHMPLKKVMELEAGGVLPLGLLLDSELVLMAPGNKAIAQGDLVIVGNQFGLKIKKINLKSADGNIPQAKLSSNPEIDPGLLEKAMVPARTQAHSHHDEDMDDDEMDDDEKKRMSRKEVQELGKRLDQELADIGIDPGEIDELENFEADDDDDDDDEF